MSSILLDNNTRLININESNSFVNLSEKKKVRIKHKIDQINSSKSHEIKHHSNKKQEQIVYFVKPVSQHKIKLYEKILDAQSLGSKIKKVEEKSDFVPLYRVIIHPNYVDCKKSTVRVGILSSKEFIKGESVSKNKNHNLATSVQTRSQNISHSHHLVNKTNHHSISKRQAPQQELSDEKPIDLYERTTFLSAVLKNIIGTDEDNNIISKSSGKNDFIQHKIDSSPEQLLKEKQYEQELANIKKFFLETHSNINRNNAPEFIISNADSDDINWRSMVKLDTSPDTWRFSHKLYNQFQSLKETKELDKKFMLDYPGSTVKIKNNIVNEPTRQDILKQFKLAFPKLEVRQLISTYANEELLAPAYMKMLTSTPEFFHYEPQDTNITYELKPVDHGLLKLSVMHTAKLKFINKHNEIQFVSFGLRASIILTTNRNPNIKYSYYFK
ncbi:Putative uncharacterized protein Yba3 [Buchnera aphidicola (Eriosoma lanigerum)]|uniref:hypothetical protein n=1 Tax=Buchnera aphidicola TaxID=9 RepID=UPI00346433EF